MRVRTKFVTRCGCEKTMTVTLCEPPQKHFFLPLVDHRPWPLSLDDGPYVPSMRIRKFFLWDFDVSDTGERTAEYREETDND